MAFSKRQINALDRIISTAQKLRDAVQSTTNDANQSSKRNRRSSAEAERMKDDIRKARAKGVPVARLAEKYNVSTAYIYMVK